MSWIKGQQDAPSLHINMLTVSWDFSIQGVTRLAAAISQFMSLL